MPATSARPPGTAPTRLFHTAIETPLGPMVLGATDRGACLCEFDDRRALGTERRDLERHFEATFEEGTNPHLERLASELAAYFAGSLREFTVHLDTPGSPFQRRVWDRLRAIPYGTTTTYGTLAAAVNAPGGARAVGAANGSNRLAVVVPCHRVIDSSGGLHGYGGGLHRKRWLLDHERAHAGTTLWSA